MHDIGHYLSGEQLYGDDFTLEEIKEWFKDEEEAYAELGAKERDLYEYCYHGINIKHGYSLLPEKRFTKVLGFGSAWGDELKPIITQIDEIVILDPSEAFIANEIDGVPTIYIKPNVNDSIDCESNGFDLITCFGALHHVPNVSSMIGEMYRCLKEGGYLLLREPTVSMGDWRKPRGRLTKRERGIPIKIFDEIVKDKGFEIVSRHRMMFPCLRVLGKFMRGSVWNSRVVLFFDRIFCFLVGWNNIYHAVNPFQKIRPTSVFYVLRKP